jgi:L-lactate dehydrogenase complex protein LldG
VDRQPGHARPTTRELSPVVEADATGDTDMSAQDPRAVVLDRIRAALAFATPSPVDVPRNYDHTPFSGMGDTDRFIETLTEYRARMLRIESAGIATAIASLVRTDGRVAVPYDVPTEWTEEIDTVVDRPEKPLTVEQLDRCDAVLTGCALAVAATGTIVLDAGATQGRRALTLVPDHHICVVFTTQVIDTVPQAFATLDPTKPLTFISGPSATSDIELSRVEGVHGPRSLDVLLVAANPHVPPLVD